MTVKPMLVSAFLVTLCIVQVCAQKAPQPKPSPLTEVTHDSTLTGNGTPSSPLGLSSTATIAGSNVTGNIAAGQITGSLTNATMSGTKLTDGSVGPAKLALELRPFRVVDSLGNEVGLAPFFLNNFADAYRYSASLNNWLHFALDSADPSGFVLSASIGVVYFQSTDCTGTRYTQNWNAVRFPLFALDVRVVGNRVYYPTGSTVPNIMFNSYIDPASPTTCGSCPNPFCDSGEVTPVDSFPLSDLGLTPPFRLVR